MFHFFAIISKINEDKFTKATAKPQNPKRKQTMELITNLFQS